MSDAFKIKALSTLNRNKYIKRLFSKWEMHWEHISNRYTPSTGQVPAVFIPSQQSRPDERDQQEGAAPPAAPGRATQGQTLKPLFPTFPDNELPSSVRF